MNLDDRRSVEHCSRTNALEMCLWKLLNIWPALLTRFVYLAFVERGPSGLDQDVFRWASGCYSPLCRLGCKSSQTRRDHVFWEYIWGEGG